MSSLEDQRIVELFEYADKEAAERLRGISLNPIHFENQICILAQYLHDPADPEFTTALLTNLLLAVLYSRSQAYTSFRKLSKGILKKSDTILIVAGGVKGLEAESLAVYRRYISDAVSKFNGVVFSGGTANGIPGLTGSVVEELRIAQNRPIPLIGVMPKALSPGTVPHPAYTLQIHTDCPNFTIREPITMWAEILAAGIPPSQVALLGINGGTISAFEYRLALTLGSKVHILQGSGRTADELLLDEKWLHCANLVKDSAN